MTQNELPIMHWPAITVLILLVILITATLIYVRNRTRKGWNDEPIAQTGEDEDNSIQEWWRMRNEQEFK